MHATARWRRRSFALSRTSVTVSVENVMHEMCVCWHRRQRPEGVVVHASPMWPGQSCVRPSVEEKQHSLEECVRECDCYSLVAKAQHQVQLTRSGGFRNFRRSGGGRQCKPIGLAAYFIANAHNLYAFHTGKGGLLKKNLSQ